MQPEKMEKRALAVCEERWYNIMACAKRSGQAVKAYCAENGVAAVHLLQVAEEAAEFSAGDTETAAVLI